MRTLSIGLILALAMSIGPIDPANAQERVLVVKIQDLNLTDAQEARIADIRKECGPKVQAAAKELGMLAKEEVEKIREVLTVEQRQKLPALREDREERRDDCLAHTFANLKELDLTDDEMTKIGEIRKEFRPRMEQAVKGLSGLLTDAQRKAREDALAAGKKRKEVLAALQLTDDQKLKLETAAKEVSAIVREEMEKIRDVLTEAQKEKLVELAAERKEKIRDRMACRIVNFADLNLTGEQQTKFANIRQEYRPKVHEAGNKLRAAIREEVEQIVAILKG